MKLSKYKEILPVLILYIIFFAIAFKASGVQLFILGVAVYVLPLYCVIRLYKQDVMESLILSLFLSIGLVPTFVYYTGLIISFRLAIFVYVILVFLIYYYLKKKLAKSK